MKITIIGTGYVGLVSGTCFAEVGNKVTCVDIDFQKIEKLKQGIIPIYEPGLEPMVKRNLQSKNLFFSTQIETAIQNADFIFIAVGTPMGEDGSADLQYVLSVAKSIGTHLEHSTIVVNKSTVPVGTADKIQQVIQQELNARNKNILFEVVSNPEFLKEGKAIDDFMKPDRIVIGANTPNALAQMKKLYKPFFLQYERFISMDIRSAEMTKYASNAMLATKISFMNEVANICEKVGADVNKVRLGIGSDNRIGYSFIYPGCGYGGSCFPKDVKALKKIGETNGYFPELISAVDAVNNRQKQRIAQKIIQKYGENLTGKTFAVWGLAFKPETDDMREAPSINIIETLTKCGAFIHAYDPKATEQAQNFYLKNNKNIRYFSDKYEAIKKTDALLLLTEWKEFRNPDFEIMEQLLNQKVIFDGRNQYHGFDLIEQNWEYHQIGVSTK